MTYGRELSAAAAHALDGAVVSHPAELVRGNLSRPHLAPVDRAWSTDGV